MLFELIGILLIAGTLRAEPADATQPSVLPYARLVEADQPDVWWRFSNGIGEAGGRIVGKVDQRQEGPRRPRYPAFEDVNTALAFHGDGGSVRIADPGADSRFDFSAGDSLTLEAWVHPVKLSRGQQMYVIGKGRTQNKGFARDNQNWALRLTGTGNGACISFLFRGEQNRPGNRDDWHRWNSSDGFAVGSGWHHIAVSYTFGDGDSLLGYLDGKPVEESWDYGGKTDAAPVVDDDEVWIGSSMGGNPSSTFHGSIDEIALYRRTLPPERFRQRYHALRPKPYRTPGELVTAESVLVEVMEGIPDRYSWDFVVPKPSERFRCDTLAFVEVPHKYNQHGVRADRTNPYMIRASTLVELPAGDYRLLVRSRSGARLAVDGEMLVETGWPSKRTDGHNHVHDVVSHVSPNLRAVQPGDREKVVAYHSEGGEYRFELEVFAGGRNRRPEFGETSVSIAKAGGDDFQLVSKTHDLPLTDSGWREFESAERSRLAEVNRQRRRVASADYHSYWEERHAAARKYVRSLPPLEVPPAPTGPQIRNDVDRFIARRLAEEGMAPAPLVDDWAFARRVALDLIGTPPEPALLAGFRKDRSPDRRGRLIDGLLADPGWADNWMGYWQDVLAENPNVINPTLNNTGPFRWWLYESFSDNKPFDRMATELILMEGSSRYGGTAGFAVASQNDAPFAAKAHIIGQAFLGLNMKCARCHDAPFHSFTQKHLFSLAAMLNRRPLKLPATSTIPGGEESVQSLLVNVSLKPGETIQPDWPFPQLTTERLPPLENADDQRELLAARLTAPQNKRFARVIVNRLWRQYLGRGIVEPVDDWEAADPSHPELLDYLARELVSHDYDLKHIARLILNSATYQRVATTDDDRIALFAAPARRRMSAEQVVDSLFAAAGKRLNTEDLNIDVDGSRVQTNSISLGAPSRGWHFTSLSNERDRPSLSLPAAQTVINVLETFGWRASRQDPLTVRPQEPTILQPAILANGVVGRRITQLSEDSRFTELALEDRPLDDFIEAVYLRILSRPPRADELALFEELLGPGYAGRIMEGVEPGPVPGPPPRDGVSWSNHLKPEANRIKLEFQKRVQRGDPPTPRLAASWRQRAEDMVWALINSPEFVFIP